MASEIFLYKPIPPQADAIQVAWCYPATYAIAMASLGYLLLFAQLDTNPHVAVARYSSEDWSKAPLSGKELAGFSFSFELDFMEVLNALEGSRIPLLAEQRSREHPLIFAGGPVPTTNPEPYADFFDFFLIGEGEELLNELVNSYRRNRHLTKRDDLLKALAVEVPGVYVPSLVQPHYADNGLGVIEGLVSKKPDTPFPVKKRFIENLNDYVASMPIVSEASVFSNAYLVEVMRGCSHRCRFCLASYSTLPARGPSLEKLIEKIEAGLPYSQQIGLVGALIADHPQFAELCAYLDTKEGVRVSFGAVRADTLTEAMCRTLANSGGKSVTIAIESGSQPLRRRINKNLKQETIVQAAEIVAKSGLSGLKLYGMVGLPDESDADLAATIGLLKTIKKAHPKLDVSLGCSTFVPKAWTPFQWMPRLATSELKRRQEVLRKGLIKTARFKPSSPKWDYVQALFSRGDRRLTPLLMAMRPFGGKPGSLNRSLKQIEEQLSAGASLPFPELDWYALRERGEQEVLPWDTLDLGLAKPFLYRESQRPPGWQPLDTAV